MDTSDNETHRAVRIINALDRHTLLHRFARGRVDSIGLVKLSHGRLRGVFLARYRGAKYRGYSPVEEVSTRYHALLRGILIEADIVRAVLQLQDVIGRAKTLLILVEGARSTALDQGALNAFPGEFIYCGG